MIKKVSGFQIIKTHLKSNWKLILFLFLIALAGSILVLWIFLLGDAGRRYIAPWSLTVTSSGPWGTGTSLSGGMGLQYPISSILLSTGCVSIFSILSLILIFITFNKEVKSTQISIWLTSPVSKKNIMLFKFLFVILTLFLIYLPMFFSIIIFASLSYDADKYFINVFAQLIYFFVFVILISAVFSLILTTLSDKVTLAIILCVAILVWMFLTSIIISFSHITKARQEDIEGTIVIVYTRPYKWLENFKYIAPQTLYAQFLTFNMDKYILDQSPKPNEIYEVATLNIAKTWWLVISVFINISLICLIETLNLKIVNKKDFNI
ncbi:hypothetical protein mflW37_2640 [Mesoplasma florum W37]|uniref:Uncharacterized protein n=1 Tax=Mesoplasma florum TaxID=2151 RepID=A0AAD2PSM5_MESFO|nr:ABC transporter permease [Mesoplasma florum]AGY41331.1 hypothetical protein mflW37_2640 [Mesoplasma florum W37]AVN59558.1 ABC transporter permease [Mesoplasma florum]AVN65671.1 hypothetical protein MflW12_2660 [Mesoplasma florum]